MSGLFRESATFLAGLAGAVLGWRPCDFWRATPAELACILSSFAGDQCDSADAADLARLKERFPDG